MVCTSSQFHSTYTLHVNAFIHMVIVTIVNMIFFKDGSCMLFHLCLLLSKNPQFTFLPVAKHLLDSSSMVKILACLVPQCSHVFLVGHEHLLTSNRALATDQRKNSWGNSWKSSKFTGVTSTLRNKGLKEQNPFKGRHIAEKSTHWVDFCGTHKSCNPRALCRTCRQLNRPESLFSPAVLTTYIALGKKGPCEWVVLGAS